MSQISPKYEYKEVHAKIAAKHEEARAKLMSQIDGIIANGSMGREEVIAFANAQMGAINAGELKAMRDEHDQAKQKLAKMNKRVKNLRGIKMRLRAVRNAENESIAANIVTINALRAENATLYATQATLSSNMATLAANMATLAATNAFLVATLRSL